MRDLEEFPSSPKARLSFITDTPHTGTTSRTLKPEEPDYDEYSSARGLTLGLDELPGIIALTQEELSRAVADALLPTWKPSVSYREATRRFAPYDDGKSSARVARWLIKGEDSSVQNIPEVGGRRRIAFWGGRFNDSAANTKFLRALREAVSRGDSDVTVIIARSAARYDALVDALRELDVRISVVGRADYTFGMTTDERVAREQQSTSDDLEQKRLYDQIYRRERRRILGDAVFDDLVLHDTLSHFWRKLARTSPGCASG